MKKLIYLFVMAMLVNGCATTITPSTPLQRKVIESKELEGTYEDTFKSTISILQDKGYQITNSDYSGGIISAEYSNSIAYGGSESYSATINFEKFTENRIRMRLSIYKQLYNSIGAKRLKFSGLTSGIVNEPKLYQDFYNEIQKEIFLRSQFKK